MTWAFSTEATEHVVKRQTSVATTTTTLTAESESDDGKRTNFYFRRKIKSIKSGKMWLESDAVSATAVPLLRWKAWRCENFYHFKLFEDTKLTVI